MTTPAAADPRLDILVAEDDPGGAQALARLLRGRGHAVRVAADGGSAAAEALSDPPDVLLLDIGLPLLDGWEVALRVRRSERGRRCLIVAVTGCDRPADRLRSRRAGIHVHLAKPVDPAEIDALLAAYRPPPDHDAARPPGPPAGGAETLVPDSRAALSPAESVERRLGTLLQGSGVPVSHVRTARLWRRV
jgi:two-component system, OmpR family, response regulator